MTDWKLANREQRGLMLAAMFKISPRKDHWYVPSQTGSGHGYKVVLNGESPRCNCPDHETTGCKCKHIFAVEVVRQRELFDDGSEAVTESVTVTETVSKTYPQDWTAYNRAQTSEKQKFQELLADLCGVIVDPPRSGRGRRPIPMGDAIFCGLLQGVLHVQRPAVYDRSP